MHKKLTMGIVVIGIIVFSLNIKTSTTTSFSDENQIKEFTALALTPHGPIEILNDGDFIDYGFNGTGTIEDPYIIENYNITTNSEKGIYILGTTKHFVICNCYVDAKTYGIWISNTAKGTVSIINNTCTNNNYGICLPAVGCMYYGTIYYAPDSCHIIYNILEKNSNGIYLGFDSDENIIHNNTFVNNSNGIYLEDGSDENIIHHNTFENNKEYGLVLKAGSDENIIHHNTFYYNNQGGTSQAYDNGKGNKWYEERTKEGNYWSDLGTKCTYLIDGFTHSRDKYPLNRKQTCLEPLTITILSIVLPLLVSSAILAFVIPKYVIPYFIKRKHLKKEKSSKKLKLKNIPEVSILLKSFIFCLILTIDLGILLYLSYAEIICSIWYCLKLYVWFFAFTVIFGMISFVLLLKLLFFNKGKELLKEKINI